MNAPVISSSLIEPSSVLRSRASVSDLSLPVNSSITYGVTNSMFGIARARSSMIFEARNSSRRWTMSTFAANLERNIASSIAESPPPTMIVGACLKNAASQVAQ